MVSDSEHRKIIKEFLDDIRDKMRSGLLVERQKILAFAASEAACHMISLLLHKKGLISPGFNVNHRFLSSEKSAREKFGFDFPEKERLIPLLVNQEKHRNILCYGRTKDKKVVEEAISNLFRIKEIIEKETGERL
jgi:hypothetical protein